MDQSAEQIDSQLNQFENVATDSFTAPQPQSLYGYNNNNHPSEETDTEYIPESQKEHIEPSFSTTSNFNLDFYSEIARDEPEPQRMILTPTQLEELCDNIIRGDKSIESVPLDQIPQIIILMKEQRDFLIAHKNIDGAEHTDQLLFAARQYYNTQMKAQSMQTRITNISKRLTKAKNDYHQVRRKFVIERTNLEEDNKAKILVLDQKQKKQLEILRTSWRSPKIQRRFNKPSPELQSLTYQSQILLNNHRYSEQRKVHQQSIRLAQIETDEKSRRMNSEYAYALMQLEKKQKSDLNALIQSQAERIDELNLKEKEELRKQEQRIKNLELEYEIATDPIKSRNLYLRNQPIQANNKRSKRPNQNMLKQRSCYADYIKLPLPPITAPRRRLNTARVNHNTQ